MRVAVLGALPIHKGLGLVIGTVERARRRRLALDVTLIGWVPGREPETLPFRATGAYREEELGSLLAAADPDVIWFPSRAPETFSYTLSAALRTDRPIVAPTVGAFTERLETDRAAALIPWDADPDAVLEALSQAASMARSPRIGPRFTRFYEEQYTAAPPRAQPDVAPVVTYETRAANGQLDACAYIRVRLPLRHPDAGIGPVVSLRDGVLPVTARAVIVQRTSITDESFAQDLVRWCARENVPLVYETDDDLFGISPTHPEFDYYRRTTAAARRIAQAADVVTTSTSSLAEALTDVNANVLVLENALDERLWFDEPIAAASAASPRHPRILYMGTFSHAADIALLRDVMVRLHEQGSRLALDVLGVVPHDEPWFQRVDLPAGVPGSYPAFVRWLRANAHRWVAGVAPLVDNAFNAAKSGIKAYDYGALGLPLVASDVRPYRELAERGFPLMLAGADPAAWQRAIEAATASAQQARERGAFGRAWVRDHATLAAVSRIRRSRLRDAINAALEVRV